jgi:hypothetical protein
MIISASRRTDIPAFFSQWLVNRLREGIVLVRNPMNFRQVSQITLSPAAVECLVFWSKNPQPMLARLGEIDDLGYPCYFLFTLTAYDATIERRVPTLPERLKIFLDLADRLGRDRVIWRYDPILFTDRFSPAFHAEAFGRLAEKLGQATERCIVSFLTMYRKCRRNLRGVPLAAPPLSAQVALAQTLRALASFHGITLHACAQGGELGDELRKAGIPSSACIDRELVARLAGIPPGAITTGKDKNRRPECGCMASIDIGAYNSCPHNCLYCYANTDQLSVGRNFAAHDPASPLLYGRVTGVDTITVRTVKPIWPRQRRLF